MKENKLSSSLVKVKGLSRDKQCLKNPHYKCACRLSDHDVRKQTLKKMRHEIGVYSFVNLMDPGLAELHEKKRRELCEGHMPTLSEKFQNFVSTLKH